MQEGPGHVSGLQGSVPDNCTRVLPMTFSLEFERQRLPEAAAPERSRSPSITPPRRCVLCFSPYSAWLRGGYVGVTRDSELWPGVRRQTQ